MSSNRNPARRGKGQPKPKAQTLPSAEPQNARSVVAAAEFQYSSPLPPPQILAGYNALVPDAANRILTMAEKQEDHRIAMESSYMRHSQWRAWGGLVAGFLIGLVGFIVALVLGLNGEPGLAGVIGVLDIGGIVGVFVYGTNNLRAERRERIETMSSQRQKQRR